MGVPQNTFGYQTAVYGVGDPQQAYAGLVYSRSNESNPYNRREYLEGSFSSPLEKDQFYEVSFYVSLAESSSFAFTDLGAYIRKGSYVENDKLTINVQPQVRDSSRFFDDKTNWMKISGLYRATGDEDHIIIGYFRTTATLNVDYQDVSLAIGCYRYGVVSDYQNYSYYYVDSVSVKKTFDCCEALGIKVGAPSSTQPCCRQLSVYKLPELLCDIYGVTVTGAEGGIALQSTPLSLNDINNATYLGTVCPDPGETRIVTVEFLDQQGNALCTKTVIVECPVGNSCCDAIGIKVDTAAVTHPCCRRISIYRKPELNCDIYGVTVVGGTGSIPLQSTPITLPGFNNATFVTQLCAEVAESKTVILKFLDQQGNVICAKTVTMTCPVLNKCCDALKVKLDTPEEAPNPCCRRISVYKLPELNCEVYGVSVDGAEGGIPLQSTPLVLNDSNNATQVATICPKPGQEWNVAVYFLDAQGNIICFKQVSGSCPEKACCNSINLGIEYGEGTPLDPSCCETIYATQPDGTDCEVYGVNVSGAFGGITWDSTQVITFPSCGTCIRRTVAYYCLEPGETRTITIEFLDKDGDVMCTKTLVRSCPDLCCDRLGVKTSPVGIGTQPCCRQIAVYAQAGLECDVYGITVTGAGGSIPLQSTPITLNDINNATYLVTVCPNPGETRTITIEFLNQQGEVICTKTVTVKCGTGGENPDGPNKQGESSENAPEGIQLPLLQSHPNPTTGETTISYQIQTAGMVKLELFDPAGRLVGVIEEGMRNQGSHTIRYQAESLPQGMYLIRLTTPDGLRSLPLVISKQ